MLSRVTFHPPSLTRITFTLVTLAVSGCSADTVILTNGQHRTGKFVDATTTIIRLRDAQGIVAEIPVSQVSAIEFRDGALSQTTGRPASTAEPEDLTQIPQQQKDFCAVLASYRSAALNPTQSDTNPIRQAQTKQPQIANNPLTFEPKVGEVFGSNARFTDWVGSLTFGVFNQSVVIRFVPECPEAVDIADFANASQRPFLPAQIAATVITLNSPLANTLSTMPTKAQVIISGNLVPMPPDPVFPRSWYKPPSHPKFMNNASGPATGATVAQPHYLAHFVNVKPAHTTDKNSEPK